MMQTAEVRNRCADHRVKIRCCVAVVRYQSVKMLAAIFSARMFLPTISCLKYVYCTVYTIHEVTSGLEVIHTYTTMGHEVTSGHQLSIPPRAEHEVASGLLLNIPTSGTRGHFRSLAKYTYTQDMRSLPVSC